MIHSILWFMTSLKLLHRSHYPLSAYSSIASIKEVNLLCILDMVLMRDGSQVVRAVHHSNLILRIVTVVKVQIWNEIEYEQYRREKEERLS